MSSTCPHLRTLPEPPPQARTPEGCEECLASGGRWVHLRLCLDCGHVGCCDSSPGRHATAHYESTGHPIMASFESGEDWRWCYPDQMIL